MDNELHEPELRLKDLLFSPLHHWRAILIGAIVLAVLLGGFRGVKSLRVLGDADALREESAAYEDALSEYTDKKHVLEQSMETAQFNLEAQRKYLENSILMSLDYRSVYELSTSLYIETDYQILPGMAYQNPDKASQIASAYMLALEDDQIYQDVASQTGTEVKYIKELITVTIEQDHLITVAVQHCDKEQAEATLSAITGQLDSIEKTVSDTVGEHTLKVLGQHGGFVVNRELAEVQVKALESEKSVEEALKKYREALSSLQEPADDSISPAGALKDCVKWAVVGFVVGAVLIYCLFCAIFLMGGKVYSAGNLAEFCGVRILGCVANEDRKRCFIDRWLRKLERRIPGNSDANNALLAANTRGYCPEGGKLLVTGDAGDEKIAQIGKLLQEKLGGIPVLWEGGLLRDAKAVEALAHSDAVVLVETCGKSLYTRVSSEISTVSGLGKAVIGCILYD